jgi:hypothetical protein
VEEYGQDLEQCQLLNVEFEETAKIISSQGNKVNECIGKGNKLIELNSIWTSFVKETNQKLNTSWAHLRNATKTCKESLSSALLVHKFGADCDDLVGLIRDKLEDIPDLDNKQLDLARRRVENLSNGGFTKLDYILQASARVGLADKNKGETLRECTARHEALQREMVVLEKQKNRLEKEAERLSHSYSSAADHINGKLHEVLIGWNILAARIRSRRDELKESLRVQIWIEECHELLSWIKRQQALITEVKKLPTDVESAENLIQKNQQHGQDLQSHENVYNELLKSGQNLQKELPEFNGLLEDKMQTVTRAWNTLHKTWKMRKDVYEENLDLRRFLHEGRNLQQWLVEHEQQLQAGQPIKSLSSMAIVDSATTEHNNLLQKVKSAEARFRALERLTLLERHLQGASEEDKDDLVSADKLRDIKRMATKLALQERARQGSTLVHSQTVRGASTAGDISRPSIDSKVPPLVKTPSKTELLESPSNIDKTTEGGDIRRPNLKAKFSMRSQPPSPKGLTTPAKELPIEIISSSTGASPTSADLPPLPGRGQVGLKTIGVSAVPPPMLRINVDNILDEESSSGSSSTSSSSSDSDDQPSPSAAARETKVRVNETKAGKRPSSGSVTESPTGTAKIRSEFFAENARISPTHPRDSSAVTTPSSRDVSRTQMQPESARPSQTTGSATSSRQTPKLNRQVPSQEDRPKSVDIKVEVSGVSDSSPVSPQNISVSLSAQSAGSRPVHKGAISTSLQPNIKAQGKLTEHHESPSSPTTLVQPSSPGGRPSSVAVGGNARVTATLRPGAESPTFNVPSSHGSAGASRQQSSTLPPDYHHDKKQKKESHGLGRLVPKFMKSKSKKDEDN